MRFSSLPLTAAVTVWCIAHAAAQPAAVKTPSLGFAWDERSKDLRPVQGIPGAALLGDAAGFTGFSSIAVSPQHDLALAISDGRLQLLRFSTGEVQDVPGSSSPSRLIFSPSGNAALAIGNGLQIITGLSGVPAVQDLILPSDAPAPSATAVSDDGHLVLFTTADSIWRLAPGTNPIALPIPGLVSAVAFRPGSREAIVVTQTGTLYRIADPTFSNHIEAIAGTDERLAAAVALRISPDGTRIYTANRTGTLAVLDVASSSITAVDCGCTPAGIEPLSTPGIYRITEISQRPLMLLDVSHTTPRVWFVPALAMDAQRSAQ